MFLHNPKRWLRPIIGVIALCGIALGLWFLYRHFTGPIISIDAPLQKAFDTIPSIHSYAQYVETQTTLPSRRLKIIGIYIDDTAEGNFASYSTTTLSIDGDPHGHVFTHQNIVISANLYLKIETSDKLLKASIQSSPEWRHFTTDTIPPAFAGIAVPGPIQDNLQVFGQKGNWLTLTKKWGKVAWGKETLLRYTFKLSSHAPSEAGTLQAQLSRIGQSGTVDIWIDPNTSLPRYSLFQNPPYYSTTTIDNINATSPILPPILLKS